MSALQEILRSKREELAHAKSLVHPRELKARARDAGDTRPFRAALKRRHDEPMRLIAELKKASPSEGTIRENVSVPEIISVYDSSNVDAMSILTERRFFQGELDYLSAARRITTRPLLRKDFIFDEYQIYESRAYGADALLLIVAILERSLLNDLQGLARELGLECLLEVHSRQELDVALYAGAEIIGINNRDLTTLKTDLMTTLDLVKDIPGDRTIVSESGIQTRADVETLQSTKVDAMLVGTALMKADHIEEKIGELLGRKQ